jgi:hypothetical protein
MSTEKVTMRQVIAETSKAVRSGRIEARRAAEVAATKTAKPERLGPVSANSQKRSTS